MRNSAPFAQYKPVGRESSSEVQLPVSGFDLAKEGDNPVSFQFYRPSSLKSAAEKCHGKRLWIPIPPAGMYQMVQSAVSGKPCMNIWPSMPS